MPLIRKIMTMLLLITVTSFEACYVDVGEIPTTNWGHPIEPTSTPDSNSTKVGDVYVKAYAGWMAFSIYVEMVGLGFSDDTAAAIALGFYSLMSLSLVTVEPTDAVTLAPYMVQGALVKLGSTGVTLPSGVSKITVINGIISAQFQTFEEKDAYSLSTTDQTTLLSSYAGAAVSYLDDAKETAIAADASDIAKTAVGSIAKAGITDTTQQQNLVKATIAAAVANLQNAGLKTKSEQSAATIEIVKGGTLGMKTAGFSSTTQVSLAAQIADGASSGLSSLGYTSSEINSVKTSIQDAIGTSLTTNGLSASQVSDAKTQASSAIDALRSRLGI